MTQKEYSEIIKRSGKLAELINLSIQDGKKPVSTWIKRNWFYIECHLRYFFLFKLRYRKFDKDIKRAPMVCMLKRFYMKKGDMYVMRPRPWLSLIYEIPVTVDINDLDEWNMFDANERLPRETKKKITMYLMNRFYLTSTRNMATALNMAKKVMVKRNKQVMEEYWRNQEENNGS